MEELKTERLKGSVRIRIEQPTDEVAEARKEKRPESLPLFYLVLLILTFPISALSLFLSLTP